MFANYNLIAAIAAFYFHYCQTYNRKFTHFAALVCGGLGLISIYFIQEPTAFTMMAANDRCRDRMGKYFVSSLRDAIWICLLIRWVLYGNIQFFYRNPAISCCFNLRVLVSTFLTANLFTLLRVGWIHDFCWNYCTID
jgi:hypothetical protein